MYVGIDEVLAWATQKTNRAALVKRAAFILEHRHIAEHYAEDLVHTATANIIHAHDENPDRIERKPTPADTAKAISGYFGTAMYNARQSDVRRRRFIEQLTGEPPETPRDDPGLTQMELRATVQQALQELTERERQAVYLRYWEDLTGPDIAKKMGIAPGTVKALTHRAHARLRANDELRQAWESVCRPSERTISQPETSVQAEVSLNAPESVGVAA